MENPNKNSLFSRYEGLSEPDWKYYNSMPAYIKNKVMENFCSETAKDFIHSYFQYGGKEKILDLSFIKDYIEKGKHAHTVALYFLGCTMSPVISDKLKCFIKKYIPDKKHKDNEEFEFCYTWFLTCLYHDAASCIEKTEWALGCPSDLDFYLGKNDIEYNVYEHIWENPHIKPYTYCESLVKNYFKYRVEYCHSIDHGIIAGYLLYDRLVKNYNSAWKDHLKRHPNSNYSKFVHNGLSCRIGHIAHFAIIADAIIAHNIWYSDSETETLYTQYGLDPLINRAKININNNPLVFFLGLLDTIEPIKRLESDRKITHCLKSIDMQITNNDRLKIKILDDDKYLNWLRQIEENKMSTWLDVCPDFRQKKTRSCKEFIIKITTQE